jgi:uncharacterized membrane protein YccC
MKTLKTILVTLMICAAFVGIVVFGINYPLILGIVLSVVFFLCVLFAVASFYNED